MEKERARHEKAIYAQQQESVRLARERELLAQEQQQLMEEIEKLRKVKFN